MVTDAPSEYSQWNAWQQFTIAEDWTLRISPVLLEDDALFQCQVGAAEGVAPIRSRNAQLTVYVPPEDPYIVEGIMMEVTEDMDTTLHCVSPGGKPAADVSTGCSEKKDK